MVHYTLPKIAAKTHNNNSNTHITHTHTAHTYIHTRTHTLAHTLAHTTSDCQTWNLIDLRVGPKIEILVISTTTKATLKTTTATLKTTTTLKTTATTTAREKNHRPAINVEYKTQKKTQSTKQP